MASTQVVHLNPDFVQSGTYNAIEMRRAGNCWFEGVLDKPQAVNPSTGVPIGDFAVTQRAAGAGQGVDVNYGEAFVMGDYGTLNAKDGLYYVRSEAALTGATQIDIATGDSSNPRIDLIILEVKDSTQDGSGLNRAQVRCVTGTPTSGLISVAFNSTSSASETGNIWTTAVPTLPPSAIPLAAVYVPANDTTISNDQIIDLRPSATGYYYKFSSTTLTTTSASATLPTAASNPASNRPYLHIPKINYQNGFVEFAAMTGVKSVTNSAVVTIFAPTATTFNRESTAGVSTAYAGVTQSAGLNQALLVTQTADPSTSADYNPLRITTPGIGDQSMANFETGIATNPALFPHFCSLGMGSTAGTLSSHVGLSFNLSSAGGTITVGGYMLCVRILPMATFANPDVADGGRGPKSVSLRGPA